MNTLNKPAQKTPKLPAGTVEKHFVIFLSPGTFVSETTEKPIDSWDTTEALKMVDSIHERHGATPYGFQFATRRRGPDDLDSKEVKRSSTYWLGGNVLTAEEILAGTDPKEEILRLNVRGNNIKRIIVNNNSWKFTSELKDNDVVLDWTPKRKKK